MQARFSTAQATHQAHPLHAVPPCRSVPPGQRRPLVQPLQRRHLLRRRQRGQRNARVHRVPGSVHDPYRRRRRPFQLLRCAVVRVLTRCWGCADPGFERAGASASCDHRHGRGRLGGPLPVLLGFTIFLYSRTIKQTNKQTTEKTNQKTDHNRTTPTRPTNATAVCQPGHGGTSCALCPVGTWSSGGTPTVPKPPCTPCSSNSTTLEPGGTNATACSGAPLPPDQAEWGLNWNSSLRTVQQTNRQTNK